MAGELENLQIWLPKDSFELERNRYMFLHTIKDYHSVEILQIPHDDNIYVGGINQKIYHTVEREDVLTRVKAMRETGVGITSLFNPTQDVLVDETEEEARVRELHLGLGRTSMLLAIDSLNESQFLGAVDDLKTTLAVAGQHAHEYDAFVETPRNATGLDYLFVQAARRNKALSTADAAEIAMLLDGVLLPLKDGRTWMQKYGSEFMKRVATKKQISLEGLQPLLPPLRSEPIGTSSSSPHIMSNERKKDIPRVPLAPRRARAVNFLNQLNKSSVLSLVQSGPYNYKYDLALQKSQDIYLGDKKPEALPSAPHRIELAKAGVSAYLEVASRTEGDPADQIMDFIASRRGKLQIPLKGLLLTGNLLTAKANALADIQQQAALPGLRLDGVVPSFEAIRAVFDSERTTPLGEVVESFLRINFAKEMLNLSFELQPASEGMVTVEDYSQNLGMGLASLTKLMNENGIYPESHLFKKKYVAPGLTKEDQFVLDELTKDHIITPMPDDYTPVSELSKELGIPLVDIDTVIKAYKIPTPLHRIGRKKYRGLSEEDRDKLRDIIAELRARKQADKEDNA